MFKEASWSFPVRQGKILDITNSIFRLHCMPEWALKGYFLLKFLSLSFQIIFCFYDEVDRFHFNLSGRPRCGSPSLIFCSVALVDHKQSSVTEAAEKIEPSYRKMEKQAVGEMFQRKTLKVLNVNRFWKQLSFISDNKKQEQIVDVFLIKSEPFIRGIYLKKGCIKIQKAGAKTRCSSCWSEKHSNEKKTSGNMFKVQECR